MLSFILSIVSLFFIFVIKKPMGILFAIFALIIALIQIKKKKTLNYIGLVLAIFAIIYSIFATVITSKTVINVVDKSKEKTYAQIEKDLATGALITVEQYEDECAESKSNCALPPLFERNLDYAYNYEDFKSTLKNCDGYIEIKYEDLKWNAKTYLNCPDYQTDGYKFK